MQNMNELILSGGDIEKDAKLKQSEINHLRLLLAWLRCEYMLDEHMQNGFASGAEEMVRLGFQTKEQAVTILSKKAEEIRHVPKYVRQAIKMLTKMIKDHESKSGIIDGEKIVSGTLGAEK